MASSFTLVALFSLALSADIMQARKEPGENWQGQVASVYNANRKINRTDCHTSIGEDGKPEGDKSHVKDFEPRPNVSSYGEDGKLKGNKSYAEDFEPRPNVSSYGEDGKLKGNKAYAEDFEPRPNVSAYADDVGLKGGKEFTSATQYQE